MRRPIVSYSHRDPRALRSLHRPQQQPRYDHHATSQNQQLTWRQQKREQERTTPSLAYISSHFSLTDLDSDSHTAWSVDSDPDLPPVPDRAPRRRSDARASWLPNGSSYSSDTGTMPASIPPSPSSSVNAFLVDPPLSFWASPKHKAKHSHSLAHMHSQTPLRAGSGTSRIGGNEPPSAAPSVWSMGEELSLRSSRVGSDREQQDETWLRPALWNPDSLNPILFSQRAPLPTLSSLALRDLDQHRAVVLFSSPS